jgi:hypothetical protein
METKTFNTAGEALVAAPAAIARRSKAISRLLYR